MAVMFVVGLVVLPLAPSRSSRTRSDGTAVSVEQLSKLYRIGELQRRVRHASRFVVGHGPPLGTRATIARTTRRSGRSEDVSFELGEGGCWVSSGGTAPEVDAAQDPDADHDAHRGTGRDPRSRRQPARGRDRLPPRAHGSRERVPERLRARHEAQGDRQAGSPRSSSSPGVEQFIDTPVKRYSSGMSVRLAFAVAAHLEPEVLLVDEVLAVGDAEFQRRCLGRMEDLSSSGRTVLFVSHQMQAVSQLCERALWLDKGEVVLDGPSSEVVARYLQSGFGAGSSREWPDLDDGAGRRPRPAALGPRRPGRRGDCRSRRSPTGRHRDRFHRAPSR